MSTANVYGVTDLMWDIRDAHSICKVESTTKGDSTAKAILWAIASRSNPQKGFTCFPSQELIAGDVSSSVRTVQRHLKLLLAEGLIKMTRRYDDSYIYCVCVDKIRTAAEAQRKIWAAEKLLAKATLDGDEAFEQAVKANMVTSARMQVADDETLPDATAIDYSEAVVQGIVAHPALAARISEAEVRNLASAICLKHAGSAPVIALGYLGDEAIAKAANGRTPIGYLRSLIEKKIAECDQSYDPSGDVEDFVENFVEGALTVKGEQYLSLETGLHPRLIDAGIEATKLRLGITFGPPCLTRDGEDTYLSFAWPDDIPSDDDDQDDSANDEQDSDESESVERESSYEDDDDFIQTPSVPAAKDAMPIGDFDDDGNYIPAPAIPVMAQRPLKSEPEYRADRELKALLRKTPSDQTEATFRLPDDSQDDFIEYLRTTFGDDCSISDGSAWIAGHRANAFLQEDRFFDPYAIERTMFDFLVRVVETHCKQSFAAIIRDFNLTHVEELGIAREHYKAWVADRYSDFLSVSDVSYELGSVHTKVSLHRGVKLPQFAEHLKNHPFVAPVTSVSGQTNFAMAS